jgi:hypothetical protein
MLTRPPPSNGGQFEFLPVTVISGNVALKAILRVGMHVGFESGNAILLDGVTKLGDAASDVLSKISGKEQSNALDKFREKARFTYGMDVGVFAT